MKWIKNQLVAVAIYILFGIVYLVGNSPIGIWANRKTLDLLRRKL